MPRIYFLVRALPLVFALLFSSADAWSVSSPPVGIMAYSLEDGSLVLKGEQTSSEPTAGVTQIQTVYTNPDGMRIQEEEAIYETESLRLKSFVKVDYRTGLREDMELAGNEVRFRFQENREEDPDVDVSDWEDGMAFGHTLVPFIRRHWQALEAGEEVEFEFLVPSRQEAVGFRFSIIGTETLAGTAVAVVLMEPSSFLIRQLVDPLKFYLTQDEAHRLLRYEGRSSVTQASGDAQDLRFDYLFEDPNAT